MMKNIIFLIALITALTILPSEPSIEKWNRNKSYNFYKENYLLKNGRIVDPAKGNVTTSESQAYIMFMSLAENDKKTFDLVYNWTKNNLRRKDGLYFWIWGEHDAGDYRVLDYNTASDADVHIARCLLTAYEKWHDKMYLNDALKTIRSIWSKETRDIKGRLVLMPGANQARSEIIEVNPSYFAPYSFRLFKKYDKWHNWNKLVDSSYYYIMESSSKTKTGLPPNWFFIKDGQIVLDDSPKSDFSYDAIRVFWRVYSDYQKTGDKRALPILSKSKIFIEEWKKIKLFIQITKLTESCEI